MIGGDNGERQRQPSHALTTIARDDCSGRSGKLSSLDMANQIFSVSVEVNEIGAALSGSTDHQNDVLWHGLRIGLEALQAIRTRVYLLYLKARFGAADEI